MSTLYPSVTFAGNALTLQGSPVSVGDVAPDFTLLGGDLSPQTLADYKGKVLLITTVPSLDTGVCDMETRRFNKEVSALGDVVQMLVVSCDLPFAQSRWCGAADAHNLTTLSDHKDLSFGLGYGVAIEELRLLTRAVFVIDRAGKVTYIEIVPEVTNEPDYAAAMDAVKKALDIF